VELTLSNNGIEAPGELAWSVPDNRVLGIWANEIDATEAGVHGCRLSRQVEDVTAIRAWRFAELTIADAMLPAHDFH
jgi:hypothetical protein